MQSRFTDQNKTTSDFYAEVWVVCPGCSKKAIAKTIIEKKVARLQCQNCGYNKETSIESKLKIIGDTTECLDAAHSFFGAELWLKYPFKNNFFIAYNGEELEYLNSTFLPDCVNIKIEQVSHCWKNSQNSTTKRRIENRY